jgi:hypothetical protein
MSKRYASFMVRWWRNGARSQLIEIESIQSGRRLLFGSLADAFEWMAAEDGSATGGVAPVTIVPLPASDTPLEASAN